MTIDEPSLPGRPTLFVDRCAWSGKLGEALEAAGVPFVPHHRYFAHDTPDDIWLSAVKHNDWLIV